MIAIMVDMWKKIYSYFEKYPAQQKVVAAMLSYGLSVKNGKIYCGDIELSASKMARALKVDRRAIIMTADTIMKHKELRDFFSNLVPTCNFKEVASTVGWGVIEIIPKDASMPGILADVARIIADENISIRQAIVDDYVLKEEPRLYLITEKPLKGIMIEKIKKAKGVKGIVTY